MYFHMIVTIGTMISSSVKVMEKHESSFHVVKVASGSDKRKNTVDRKDTRLVKASERKKGTHKKSKPPF
jgi:hypothetical protein